MAIVTEKLLVRISCSFLPCDYDAFCFSFLFSKLIEKNLLPSLEKIHCMDHMTDMECLHVRLTLLVAGGVPLDPAARASLNRVLAAPGFLILRLRTLIPHCLHLCMGYGCSLLVRCKLSVRLYLSVFLSGFSSCLQDEVIDRLLLLFNGHLREL